MARAGCAFRDRSREAEGVARQLSAFRHPVTKNEMVSQRDELVSGWVVISSRSRRPDRVSGAAGAIVV
jgi:hypothetical protein